jgi:hypothetical protein
LEKIRNENQSASAEKSTPRGAVSIEVIRYLYRMKTAQQIQK